MALDNALRVKHLRHMSDTTFFDELAAALRERIAVIGDRALFASDPALHLEKLRAASGKITALQSRLPPSSDAQLAHFLQRCSYDKALAVLDAAPR